jgi:hypothetical protein
MSLDQANMPAACMQPLRFCGAMYASDVKEVARIRKDLPYWTAAVALQGSRRSSIAQQQHPLSKAH